MLYTVLLVCLNDRGGLTVARVWPPGGHMSSWKLSDRNKKGHDMFSISCHFMILSF